MSDSDVWNDEDEGPVLPRRPIEVDDEIDMTPMIDVVFQLLIFFLVASHLARQEVQLQLDLPDAGTGQRPTQDPVTP